MAPSLLETMRRCINVVNEVTIDSIDTVPLVSHDIMNIIIDLAADIEKLRRRVEVLERKTIHVREDRQGHDDTD